MLIVRRCPVCGSNLNRQNWHRTLRWVCAGCAERFEPAGAVSVAAVDQALAVWQYNEDVAPLITAAKSVGGASALKRLAPPLAARIKPFCQTSSVITWIPPSPRGLRRRGFDQGRVLARAVGGHLGLPVEPAFRRSGRAQFGGSRSIRLEGPRLRCRPGWQPKEHQIVLIDDVITTGTSVATAAQLVRTIAPDIDIVAAALAVRL